MQRFSFYDREKNKSTLETLANALASRRQSQVNTGTITAPHSNGQETNEGTEIMNGAARFGKGLYNMYNKGKENGWFNFGGGSGSSSAGPQMLNMSDYTSAGGNGGFGGLDNLSFNGLGGSSATSAGGGLKGFGGFGGGGGSTPWGAIGSFAKGGYNTISGHDDSDYSDLEQSTIYPMQGASKGAQFGPWGAAAGALYGLGYSFKDDIGLKDNDWLTDIIFPIGMGDEHRGLITI